MSLLSRRTAAWISICVLSAGLSAPASAAVGRTAATYNVSQSGEAVYSIPIFTPPGINGITPHLALTYQHGSTNTLLGVGWGISGLSSIYRCSRTWAQDGGPRQVRNDYTDRFCLDGNKLRLTSGTYGNSGATYQTEIETFARVTSNGVAGNGPSYFIVERKDGLIYEYGNTADSRIESVGQSTVRAWAVNKIRDRAGNAILFNYTEDATNGAYRIASIQYTSNTAQGISPSYSVEFAYETKPSNEIDSGYLAGSVIKQITRLDRLDVKYNGTTTVRRYELTYEGALSSTSRSRLHSVQECAGASLDCFPATIFSYQDGSLGLSAETNTATTLPTNPKAVDVNGDGRTDLLYSSSAIPGSGTWMVMFANSSGGYNAPVNTGITNTNYSGAITIDYNADGLYDLLVPYSGGTWWVMLGTTSGLASPVNTSIAVTATGSGVNAVATDIDGDGLQDLVWADLSGYAGGDAIRYRLRVWGGTFSSTVSTLVGPQPVDTMITSWTAKAAGTGRMTDFNGDGRGDVAYSLTTRVWNGTKYLFFYSIDATCSGQSDFGVGTAASSTTAVGDFNGDGKTDLIYYTSATAIVMRLSTGTSFTSAITIGSIAGYTSWWTVLDWDGDGYDDLLLPNYTAGVWHLFRSTGEALAAPVTTGLPFAVGTTSPYVADLNGDGMGDVGYLVSGVLKYRVHAGVMPDLMLTATDGFGLATSFSYVALTQNNYTKYASLAYPDQDYQGPLYVVASMTAPTGIASPTSYTQSFWYWGAALNLQGRGSEGFYARRVIDNRDSLQHYDYYRRDFPYIGLTFQSDVYQTDGATLLSRVQNAPASSSFGAGYETRYFPYVSSATSDRYELGGTRNGAWLQRDSMSVGIDGYGNATSLTTSSQDKDSASPWVGETFTQVTTNTITNDAVNWCLGRPTQTTLQSTLPDTTSQTRTQGATIDYPNCRATQSVIEPASSTLKVTTTYGFDGCGNVNSIQVVGKKPDGTDMPTRTTGLNYGTRCQFPETLTNALSESTTIAYKYEFGVQSSVTDPNGLARSFLYDDFGRKTRDTRPDSTYTTWTPGSCDASNSYCGVSDLRSYFTEAQYTTGGSLIRSAYLYYDGLDRLRYNEQRNLAGGLTNSVTLYDAFGRTSVQYMPYSSSLTGTRQWSYDALSRVTADALYTAGGSLDRQTTYAYTGRYVAITDPRANVTQRYLDVRGQLRRLVDASPGGTTSYTFDHFGNLTSATDPAGNVTSAGYNLRGFVTSTSDVDRGTWTYTPNSLGEVLSQTDAKSQTVTMTFDALSRPLTRVETEGTSTWTWGALADNTPSNKYVGRLKALSGPGYSESFVFDSLGRPQTTTYAADTSYQVDYTFDATTGYLDNVTYPTSTASYRLRAQYLYTYGILSQVRDFNAPSTVWWQLNAIDDRGNPVDEQLANGVHILANNDGLTGHLNWRTSGTNASSWNNQQNLTYAWDKNENLKDRIDVNQSSLTEHFEYDALNRLDYSTLNGVTNLDVTLDAIGNITYRSDVGTYTYHATRKHAVASTGAPTSWSFTYDNNGNMQSGRGATIHWTSYNLPDSITNGSLSSSFSYTPDRRYWKQVGQYSGGPETTIYIGGILEKSSGATTTDYKHFIRAGSATVIVTRSTGSNNNTYYVTADSLGSSASITNSAGSQVLNESFAAYGARRGSNWNGLPTSGDMTNVASTTRRGYTGHTMLDNLSLIHMNGRVFDPLVGRFLSADPMVDGRDRSRGYNRYSYVGNDPVSLLDPSGFSQKDVDPPAPVDPTKVPVIGEMVDNGRYDNNDLSRLLRDVVAAFAAAAAHPGPHGGGGKGTKSDEAQKPTEKQRCEKLAQDLGFDPSVLVTPPIVLDDSWAQQTGLSLVGPGVALAGRTLLPGGKTRFLADGRSVAEVASEMKLIGDGVGYVGLAFSGTIALTSFSNRDMPGAFLAGADTVAAAGILAPPPIDAGAAAYVGVRLLFDVAMGNTADSTPPVLDRMAALEAQGCQ